MPLSGVPSAAANDRGGNRRHRQLDDGPQQKISSLQFYGEYYGHRVEHLRILLRDLRRDDGDGDGGESVRLIWTAGDSSLDNKYWFNDSAAAPSDAYRRALDPPRCIQDVTYWLNYLLQESNDRQEQERQEQSFQQQREVPASNLRNRSNSKDSGNAKKKGADSTATATTTRETTKTTTTKPAKATAAINTAVEATTLNERTYRLRPQDRFLRDNLREDDILVVSVGTYRVYSTFCCACS